MYSVMKRLKLKSTDATSWEIRGCIEANLQILQLFGFWPTSFNSPIGRYQRIWLALFPIFQLTTGFYSTVIQVYNIYLTWGKVSSTCELSGSLMQLAMCLLKTALLVFNGKRLQRFVERMDKLQKVQACNFTDRMILQRTQSKSREFSLFYTKLGICLIVVIMIATTIGGYIDHEIPYRHWYPYDEKKSPMFELTLLTYMVLTMIEYFLIGVVDVLFMAITIELIGQFKLLHINAGRCLSVAECTGSEQIRDAPGFSTVPFEDEKSTALSENRAKLLPAVHHINVKALSDRQKVQMLKVGKKFTVKLDEFRSKTVEERLISCVRHHKVLISLVAELESIFQPALIFHFVCNLFCGLFIPYFINKKNLDIKMLSFVALGTVTLAEFLTYCWFCTRLTTESEKLGETLYACPWWEATACQKKLLRIFLLRARIPLTLTVVKIYPMSMESFTKVMNAAYNIIKVVNHISWKWAAPGNVQSTSVPATSN